MKSIDGKVVVITGASRGLGRELARIAASKGAHVVVSSRAGDELKEVAREIDGVAVVADVTKESDLRALAEAAVSKFGKIDIWVNNAGIWVPYGPAEDLQMDKVRAMFEVNVFGLMEGSRVALKQMRTQGKGMIVNIVSTSALSGRPLATAYASSKYAAKGFTESLREELRGTSIKIIAVHPGGMKTQLFDEKKHPDYENFVDPAVFAEKIIDNLESLEPQEDQILRRPNQ